MRKLKPISQKETIRGLREIISGKAEKDYYTIYDYCLIKSGKKQIKYGCPHCKKIFDRIKGGEK